MFLICIWCSAIEKGLFQKSFLNVWELQIYAIICEVLYWHQTKIHKKRHHRSSVNQSQNWYCIFLCLSYVNKQWLHPKPLDALFIMHTYIYCSICNWSIRNDRNQRPKYCLPFFFLFQNFIMSRAQTRDLLLWGLSVVVNYCTMATNLNIIGWKVLWKLLQNGSSKQFSLNHPSFFKRSVIWIAC